jgi:hypothetical protein
MRRKQYLWCSFIYMAIQIVSCRSMHTREVTSVIRISFNEKNRAKVLMSQGDSAMFYVRDKKYSFKLLQIYNENFAQIEFDDQNKKEAIRNSRSTRIILKGIDATVYFRIGFVHKKTATIYLYLDKKQP